MFRRELPSLEESPGGLLLRLSDQGTIAPGNELGMLASVTHWPADAQPLGYWHDQPLALSIEMGETDWLPAREWLAQLPGTQAVLISTALQVATWQRDHRYCGRCGTGMQRIGSEFAMQCPACKHRNYPRISPCIITLVTYGEDLLLARSPRFPPGRYSTLAGFIEPGESAEDAVRREVHEEVGVDIGRIAYYRSQSWPFPHSLMLGYFAEAASRRIVIDGIEIADAAWFSPRHLPQLPPPYSISRELIETHLKSVGIR